ncbi:hypothetical protein [Streptomyces sp. NPDC002785]|uniref:hypothetical protein n=1 Tax=Streptomyces sp. NPDC002785 TaxID=3154543 RepID=UPI003317AE5E
MNLPGHSTRGRRAGAAGLVLYFLGALGAHLRVGDHQLGGWGVCSGLAPAALITNLTTSGPRDLVM